MLTPYKSASNVPISITKLSLHCISITPCILLKITIEHEGILLDFINSEGHSRLIILSVYQYEYYFLKYEGYQSSGDELLMFG